MSLEALLVAVRRTELTKLKLDAARIVSEMADALSSVRLTLAKSRELIAKVDTLLTKHKAAASSPPDRT